MSDLHHILVFDILFSMVCSPPITWACSRLPPWPTKPTKYTYLGAMVLSVILRVIFFKAFGV